jgi:hypothetical protein
VGRLIINNAITVNGAFEAPVPEPDGWLVLDPDSQQASLEMWQAADPVERAQTIGESGSEPCKTGRSLTFGRPPSRTAGWQERQQEPVQALRLI